MFEDKYRIRPYSSEHVLIGVALIINVYETLLKDDEGKEYTDFREGSLQDVKSLNTLFQYLNFEVKTVKDLTASEIKKVVLEFVESLETLHRDKDMCAVIIMGHGFDGVIFGRDGEKVNIRMDILDQFSNENCSAMIDKPKMFVFQSCRGLRRDTGVFNKKCLIRQASIDGVGSKRASSVLKDSIEAYSTICNFAAWRNKEKGSFFIQKMVEVFIEFAHQEEIQTLFKRVTKEINNMRVEKDKREYIPTPPEIISRMDKDLYFQPALGSVYDVRPVRSNVAPGLTCGLGNAASANRCMIV